MFGGGCLTPESVDKAFDDLDPNRAVRLLPSAALWLFRHNVLKS